MRESSPEETSWEINLRVPYEQIMASGKEKDKIKKLQVFIARSVKLVEKKIVNFDEFEDLDDVLGFMERLLVVLNESHRLLQSELPGFDDKILPILEKYASLLVYQSSLCHSQEKSMTKLLNFLSSLPVHEDLKILPQTRVKKILKLILNAAQSGSNEHRGKSSKLKTKKLRDTASSQNEDHERNQATTVINQPEASPVISSNKLISLEPETAPESSPPQDEQEHQMHKNNEMLPEDSVVQSDLPVNETASDIPKKVNDTENNSSQAEFTTAGENSEVSHGKTDSTPVSLLSAHDRSDAQGPISLEKAEIPVRHTDLRELQKMLRNRFSVPWNVTTTEKYLLRKLLLLLKSNKPRKPFVWKITLRKLSALTVEKSKSETIEPEPTSDRDTSTSSKLSEASKTTCDNIESFKSAQSEAKPENTSSSEQDESFFSCKTPQDDSIDSEPSVEKEDPFDRLKRLDTNKSGESELTLSDVELMEEMEITLRRLEKENEGESDKSELPDDPLPCTSNLLETLPPSTSSDEHNKLGKTTNSAKVADKSTPTPSAAERRRSPRLAGLPALPLIFTRQPLPGKRKCSSPTPTGMTSRCTNASDGKKELYQMETIAEESPREPTPKRPRYCASETPNLPKKPVRRRIVSTDHDPYTFIASDEEFLIEDPKPQSKSLSKKKLRENPDHSSQRDSPDVVELSPASDGNVKAVFSQVKSKEQTKENSKNKSLDVMPITPESETGSCRAGSSLNFNGIHDEKSNDSIEEIAVVNTQSAEVILSDSSTSSPLWKMIAWEEIRKLLPTCWAAVLEEHVKVKHSDELLLCKEPDGITSSIPTVYCCSKPDA